MSRPVFLSALVLLVAPALASADVSAELAVLKQQLAQISQRIAQLEGEHAGTAPPEAPATARKAAKKKPAVEVPKWTQTVKFGGDLRYRHESIDQDGSDERTRHRVRARVSLKAKPAPNTEVGVRLASGGLDPVSTNQTLDESFSTKDIRLDQAYLKVGLGGGSTVIGGKMSNPLYMPGKSSLVWDSDLTPEGLAWTLSNNGFFANAVAFSVEERGSDSDTLMFGGQVGLQRKLDNGVKLTGGIGLYDYSAIQGRSALIDGAGNTLDDGVYMYDYRITEVFGELATKISNVPVSFFVDWVQNTEAGSEDTGIAIGTKIGKASNPGEWDFGYWYKDLEADAVVGTFSDSDFGGGGTAVDGHVLSFGYAITKKLTGKLTYIITENRTNTNAPRDYNRLQADIAVKY